ncbi:MAG TPA: malto-oligosyltrehalose synthase [Thermoanaerobaculia bacterium]|nr:malto-oligosyltrehalose synthase [Thermoanaerobaculia bacterium]
MFRIPISTYRIQFNAAFTFEDARKVVAYLAELGISDLYSSPLLRPRKGSTHGYDIVDATTLNPELGTRDDFNRLHDALRSNEMGLLLDIVPNHMAASHENAWWMSVLENGAQSRYLHYFDIDWRDNKVLLPILGKPYGEALESGELKLGFDEEGFFIAYYDKRLPVAPQSYKIVLQECVNALPTEGPAIQVRDIVANDDVIANSRFLKDTLWRVRDQSQTFRSELDKVVDRFNSDFDLLDKLIDAQAYRLAYWRIASETINYRRFFDVTDLVGVRVENPEVFETRNDLILKLIAEEKVTGVRIDHIDGLYEPVNYLAKLQVRLGEPATEEAEQFYVVVEKILEAGEELPTNFRCAGTTGYDFLDTANAVFVDPAGLGALTEFYHQYTGFSAPYEDVVYERKKQAIEQLFYGEMRALGSHLAALAVADRNARDFSPSELSAALLEVTACMPVYRTYVREAAVSDTDRGYIEHAVAEARKRAKQVDVRLFDFVDRVLLLDVPKYISSERDKWLEFVMRWQQFTGRVMAKGVEDTAFYNYNSLVSLNEVGGEPGRGSDFDPVAELHERNERIARTWPNTMNATSTHDTKRAEDVRARISVLSEMPELWQREVRRWTRANEPLKRDGAPDANEELLIYQTLVGMWPLDDAERGDVPDRMRGFLEKAAREAKTHSSWLEPNAEYEKALQDFATAAIENSSFLESFRRFHKRIAFHGMLNSLSQVVLKVCSSGLPDFYQGSEMWDFSLVDPDNRRPVDYEKRMAALRKLPSPQALMRGWADGRIKLFTTARSLAARARNAEAFRGAYRAVETGTPNAVAFTRGSDEVLVCVPRLTTQIGKSFPVGEVWGDRSIDIGGRWKNAFTGETIEGERLALRDVFAAFPVAILEKA